MVLRKAVFLDRDGVINSDEGHYYVYRVEDFVLNPDLPQALKVLSDHGFALIVITNQGGVAKGVYSLQDVERVHVFLKDELAKFQVELDGIYVCPHHESIASCTCRKPLPYMINLASQELNIDTSKSYLIGDSPRDVEAGERANLRQCFRVAKNTSILDVCNQIIEIDGTTC